MKQPYKYKNIKRQIDKSSYVSFDVFDTLIKRNVENPTDLFRIIEEKYNIENFKNLRIAAEIKAKNKTKYREPNINDIYREIGLSNKDEIKKIEIDLELKLCQQNKDFYPIYKYAKENDKKIVITTDMYLQKEIIKKILDNANISYDYLFVSNDLKLNKHSGNIYSHALQTLDVNPKDLLHIGDSKRADYLIPRLHGIKAILIPKRINKLRYYKKYRAETIDENIIINFINNNLPLDKDIYYRIGYEILGILLLGFSKWLKKNLDVHNIKRIFFLAREGALLKSAFDLIYPNSIESHYLYVSRRSTRVSLLKNVRSIDDVFNICNMRRILPAKDFFQNVGLDINNYQSLLEKYDFTPKTDIRHIKKLDSLFLELKKDIQNNAAKEERDLLSYLKHENFSGKISVCDIGWYGTMQKSLIQITSNPNIYGSYLYCVKNNNLMSRYLPNRSFLDFRTYYEFIESFFLANHGTTIGYKNSHPILAPYEYKGQERNIFQSIQKAALQFIENIKVLPPNLIEDINPKFSFYGLRKLGATPTLRDVDLFGKIKYLDTSKNYIANPKKWSYYLFHPKTLYSDFCNAFWKTGFVKKLFRLPLNYDRILIDLLYRKQIEK